MLSLLYHRQIPAKLPNNVKNIIWLVGCYLSKEETTNSQPTFLLWCVLTGSKAKGTGPDAEIKPLNLFPNCTANQRENNEKETKKMQRQENVRQRKWGIGLVELSVFGTYIACQEASADFLPVGVKDAAVFVQVTLPLWGHRESISATPSHSQRNHKAINISVHVRCVQTLVL